MATTMRARLSEDDGYLTVPQAMRMAEVSRSRLLALVIRQDIAARQVAGQLFIERASLEAYNAKRAMK